MSLGTRIAQARSARGLSQETLARTLGVATVTPSRWERGKNRPSAELLAAISEALDVPVEWLLQDEQAVATPSPAGGPFESALTAWALRWLPHYLREHKEIVLAALREDTPAERRIAQLPVARERRLAAAA